MQRPINILIAPHTQLAFDREVIAGAGACARTYGNIVLHFNFSEYTIWQAAKEIKADGVILSASSASELDDAHRFGLPAVNVANYLEGHSRVPVVGNDDYAVGKMVADYYLENGFRHFAYFADQSSSYFYARQDAFCKIVREAGFECAVGPPTYVQGPMHDDFQELNARWLASLPKPLGIMCPYDAYALQAVQASQFLQASPKARLKVPEDVSIIGVDNDTMLCLTVFPQISSVKTAGYKIGFTALQLLQDIIAGKPPPKEPILLPPTGIAFRGSSSDMAIDDPDVAAAVSYIKTNLSHNLTIHKLVAELAVSRRTLERKFNAVLGRTPSEELRRVRIAQAKRLLIETDMRFPEIARRSGLIWHQRLSNLIKADCGMTPAQFRTRFRHE